MITRWHAFSLFKSRQSDALFQNGLFGADFVYIQQQTIGLCLQRRRKYRKMAERNPQDIDRKRTQITVIETCIVWSVDVSLRRLGARSRRNLQSTVPSATALRKTYLCLPFRRRSVTVFGGGKGCFCRWQLHMQA